MNIPDFDNPVVFTKTMVISAIIIWGCAGVRALHAYQQRRKKNKIISQEQWDDPKFIERDPRLRRAMLERILNARLK